MSKRVERLESVADGCELSAAARAWLGLPITDAERASLAHGSATARIKPAAADLLGLSREAQEWLALPSSVKAEIDPCWAERSEQEAEAFTRRIAALGTEGKA
jgi:hypothetical protein